MLRTLCTHARRVYYRSLCESASSPLPVTSRQFENILASNDERIGVIAIHRPRQMNALNEETISEIVEAAEGFENDPTVNVIIVTGSERVFAAGNDIEEMASHSFHAARFRRDIGSWTDRISAIKKPIIAAVSGFALGGGCELAMAADIVIAGEDAQFGQPEVQIGTLPSAGGTQRLVRAVGKAKAMELVLTGRKMNAEEAESVGLVTRVARKGEALKEAKDVAAVIARHSLPIVAAAKECVNVAFESTLSQGLRFEKRAFQSTFALDDQKEGMKAFIDQRKPSFKNR
ncbi:putative enoyl-CoA hydratase echA8 [Gracilariopsis chorda]|uniref:Putative enoyl-CoA hydratase echA8 n=1 Tax=Gracilariopsis chorda TaxID=448386 RepID=A0A2V3IFX3_9FLOR|nr:putative enoyl-CoA hydratase echA8 [Gracilariopsis chorda]|eukprot:PXF40951.1 putative enoyl-CoA hydratase echA8 [Gracilariopsis chorda]